MPKARPMPANVILYGVGALGTLVLDALRSGYPTIRVVGAVDHAPDKAGRPLAELYPGYAALEGIVVAGTLAECLAGIEAPVHLVYHMTESVPAAIETQLSEILEAGLDVISAAESMFHPWLRHGEFTQRLDRIARAKGLSVTGVGINPGFSFDSLPLMLARATCGVTRIDISRTIDVTGTGPGDIDHVGYALWPKEFEEKIASGRIVGHMGMPESIAQLAERLDMTIDTVEERWETATADFPVDSGTPELGMIEPGRVIGITQFGEGKKDGETKISMRLVMYYEPEDHGLEVADRIEIVGDHHIKASLVPAARSLFGAACTIVNATHDVIAAAPGFASVLDFSIGGAERGGFRYVLDPAKPPRPGHVALVKEAIEP
ncbi:4-hydroxy-tetrahydrodipicolinate reductase [Xaviernesmea oryzae]|uniref:4-hydroxy-tetrahydrodipicolinate reductase n=1 Tax=Xaviernesmea oryzae TaxID=464029 RepID=A0A1X7DBG7_9HYPH|nr:hypothetical protein [Xaviernesmea oryzae]SMF12220.1 4-hydroxy-tetrahydrodipicolinate reductase [Xaviernesmea oryzae]